MTHIEQAIRDAVEKGGYKLPTHSQIDELYRYEHSLIFLDPAFWQALGKARGWKEDWYMFQWRQRDDVSGNLYLVGCPAYHWHRFIEHLRMGGDAESFFAGLE